MKYLHVKGCIALRPGAINTGRDRIQVQFSNGDVVTTYRPLVRNPLKFFCAVATLWQEVVHYKGLTK